jgi:hypothetical protein
LKIILIKKIQGNNKNDAKSEREQKKKEYFAKKRTNTGKKHIRERPPSENQDQKRPKIRTEKNRFGDYDETRPFPQNRPISVGKIAAEIVRSGNPSEQHD